jgi:hypothetical protein
VATLLVVGFQTSYAARRKSSAAGELPEDSTAAHSDTHFDSPVALCCELHQVDNDISDTED